MTERERDQKRDKVGEGYIVTTREGGRETVRERGRGPKRETEEKRRTG